VVRLEALLCSYPGKIRILRHADQGKDNAGGTCVAIPTLSEWGILLLAIAMLGVALRRRAVRRPG
jgi:hypothetical protein